MSLLVNLVTNPSAETATTGYTSIAGTSGVAAITRPVDGGAYGEGFIRNTWSTASTAAGGGIQYADIAVTAGQVYSFGVDVKPSITNRLQLNIEWRTSGATISTVSGTQTVISADTDGWSTSVRLKAEGLTAPATATVARMKIVTVAGTSYANWSISSYLDVDGLIAVQSPTIVAYGDPSTSAMWVWTGTAHASTSTLYVPVITLTTFITADPGPRIRIDVTDLPPNIYLTVWRVSDYEAPVQDAVEAFGGGGFTVVDYIAPIGADVTYRVETFDPVTFASLGYSTTATTSMATGTKTTAWFSDPLVPENIVQVNLKPDFAEMLSTVRQIQLHSVGDRVVGLMGSLGLLSNVNLHCQTTTLVDSAMLRTILSAGAIVIRTNPPLPIPRILTVAIGTANRRDVNVQWNGQITEWPINGDEVSPIELSIGVPLFTWQDYIDAFPTWADFTAAYSTWLDAMKTPPGA